MKDGLKSERCRQIFLRYGFRLKSLFWPLDAGQVAQILAMTGYGDSGINPAGERRAEKDGAGFYLDWPKMVFGFTAGHVGQLILSQEEFLAAARKAFDVNLHDFIRFYEVENIISYRLESSRNTLQGVFSDSADMKHISGIINQPAMLSRLEVGRAGTSIHDDDWLSIEVSPKIESAGNLYFCKMISRSRDGSKALEALRDSRRILEAVAGFAEERS